MDGNTNSGGYIFPKGTIPQSQTLGQSNKDDMDINQSFREIIFPNSNNNTSERSYKCPKCGGEFNRWDEESDKDSGPSVTGVSGDKYVCPFCGTPRQEYNPEEE